MANYPDQTPVNFVEANRDIPKAEGAKFTPIIGMDMMTRSIFGGFAVPAIAACPAPNTTMAA